MPHIIEPASHGYILCGGTLSTSTAFKGKLNEHLFICKRIGWCLPLHTSQARAQHGVMHACVAAVINRLLSGARTERIYPCIYPSKCHCCACALTSMACSAAHACGRLQHAAQRGTLAPFCPLQHRPRVRNRHQDEFRNMRGASNACVHIWETTLVKFR